MGIASGIVPQQWWGTAPLRWELSHMDWEGPGWPGRGSWGHPGSSLLPPCSRWPCCPLPLLLMGSSSPETCDPCAGTAWPCLAAAQEGHVCPGRSPCPAAWTPAALPTAASPPRCHPVLLHPQPHFVFFSAGRGTRSTTFLCAHSQNCQAPSPTSAASTGGFRSPLPVPALWLGSPRTPAH